MFFDEDVPRKLARSLPQHDIHTVVSMQWGGIKNGALLNLIEREGFNAFLTGDKNMQNQQRLEGRRRGERLGREGEEGCAAGEHRPWWAR